jgi:hypothetical protein
MSAVSPRALTERENDGFAAFDKPDLAFQNANSGVLIESSPKFTPMSGASMYFGMDAPPRLPDLNCVPWPGQTPHSILRQESGG